MKSHSTVFCDKKDWEYITRYNRQNNPAEIQKIISEADRLTMNHFKLRGNPLNQLYLDLGEKINWHETPNGDREGLFSLNVHEYFENLSKAYVYTQNEKYTRTYINILKDWIENVVPPKDGKEHFWDYSPWRSLEAGRRMRYWIFSYHIFKESILWDDEINDLFVASVYEHCSQLGEYICQTDHNHTIMHMEGLLYAAVYFNKFDKSQAWINRAISVLESCAREQIREDGVHIEAIPGYHNLCIDLFLRPLIFTERNNLVMSQDYKDRISKMMAFMQATCRPDNTCTPIGDSNVFPKISFAYLASLGYYFLQNDTVKEMATLPESAVWLVHTYITERDEIKLRNYAQMEKLSRSFESAGFYCMQSSGLANRLYAMLHCGPLVHGHPHADLLSMDIFAYGKSLLTDVGIYTYNECTDRRYLKGTQAHNTVVVDGCDQAEYEHRMGFKNTPDYKVHHFEVKSDYEYVDAEHYGYHRLDEPVTHRRIFSMIDQSFYVVFDEFTGEGEHDLEQFWHMNSTSVKLSSRDLSTASYDKNEPNVQVIPVVIDQVKAEVCEGWLSDVYGTKRKASVLRYWKKVKLPAVLCTIIIPEEKGKRRKYKIMDHQMSDKKKSMLISVDNKKWSISMNDTMTIKVVE